MSGPPNKGVGHCAYGPPIYGPGDLEPDQGLCSKHPRNNNLGEKFFKAVPFNLRACFDLIRLVAALASWMTLQSTGLVGRWAAILVTSIMYFTGLCNKHPDVEIKHKTPNECAGQGAVKILSNRADILAEIGAHNGHRGQDYVEEF